MLGAIESHVLKEMRQTELIRLFESRSHFLSDIEVGPLLWLTVGKHIIAQAVGELTRFHFRVELQRRLSRRSEAHQAKDDG